MIEKQLFPARSAAPEKEGSNARAGDMEKKPRVTRFRETEGEDLVCVFFSSELTVNPNKSKIGTPNRSYIFHESFGFFLPCVDPLFFYPPFQSPHPCFLSQVLNSRYRGRIHWVK